MSNIIYFYPLLITLSIACAYTDIRFRKIHNKHLLWAAIGGLLIYAYLFLTHKIGFSWNLLINQILAFGVGFSLYATGTWGAGDAKLFSVCCLLMPTDRHSVIIPFACLAIFMNVFLVSTLIISFLSLKQLFRNKGLILKNTLSPSALNNLIKSFLIVFALGWLIPLLTKPIISYLTPFLIILIMYFSYWLIYAVMSKLKNGFVISLVLAAGLITRYLTYPADFNPPIFILYLKKAALFTLLFHIIRSVFDFNNNLKNNRIAFAPLISLGALLTNTNFIYLSMLLLNKIGR